MNTKKKRLIITGGSGFIGTHMLRLLSLNSEYVITVVDKVLPRVTGVNFVCADFKDEPIMEGLLKNADCVLHLAAMVGVDKCRLNPDEVNRVNYQNTKSLIDLCAKMKVKKFVFSSSSEVYGNSKDIPYKEDTVLEPISDYAKCKVAIEKYLYEVSQKTGLKVGIVRFFNIYGPWQKEVFVVPIFIKAALLDKPITILGDGKQTRCFTYVGDAVQGVLKLMKHNSSYEIFNIGNSTEFSVEELAKLILKNITTKSEVVYQGYGQDIRDKSLEILRRVPATEKAKEILKFQASTNLEEGIKAILADAEYVGDLAKY